jgi:predicted nucleotidyltransferase
MVIELPPDFSEFLKLLNIHQVEYLLVGGFAVGFHGYPRATSDIDIWVGRSPENSKRVAAAIREFGFDTPNLTPELFQQERKIVRMGNPPVRIEVMNSIDGVEFEQCRRNLVEVEFDGIPVPVINLADLKANKKVSGRPKDMDDLQHLP